MIIDWTYNSDLRGTEQYIDIGPGGALPISNMLVILQLGGGFGVAVSPSADKGRLALIL